MAEWPVAEWPMADETVSHQPSAIPCQHATALRHAVLFHGALAALAFCWRALALARKPRAGRSASRRSRTRDDSPVRLILMRSRALPVSASGKAARAASRKADPFSA